MKVRCLIKNVVFRGFSILRGFSGVSKAILEKGFNPLSSSPPTSRFTYDENTKYVMISLFFHRRIAS